MSFNITDTTYAGTVEAGYMITQATFGLDTVNKGVAYVKDGIKKSHTIPKIDIQKVLQPRVATPFPQGQYNVSGVKLTPQDVMVYIEFNPRDFESHFYAEQLSRTLLARELPVTAENVMMQLTLNRAFEQIENGIHMGSLAYTTQDPTNANFQIKYWDGIIRKLLVDGGYIPVPSPSTITAANILAKMDAAIAALPAAILSNSGRYDNVKFMMSPADFQLFESASTLLQFKGSQITDKVQSRYRGYNVVPLAGIPASTFYLAEAGLSLGSNLWIGTNSTDDLTLQLSRLQANSELFFFKGLFKFDVQIAKPNEFVMHTSLTTGTFTA